MGLLIAEDPPYSLEYLADILECPSQQIHNDLKCMIHLYFGKLALSKTPKA